MSWVRGLEQGGTPPHPLEVCGLASGSTARCEAERHFVSHILAGGHICRADPKAGFHCSTMGHLVKGAWGDQAALLERPSVLSRVVPAPL